MSDKQEPEEIFPQQDYISLVMRPSGPAARSGVELGTDCSALLIAGERPSRNTFRRMAMSDPFLLLDVLKKRELHAPFLATAAVIAGELISDQTPIEPLLSLTEHESPHVREGAVLGLQHHLHQNAAILARLRTRLGAETSPGVKLIIQDVLEEAPGV